MTVDISLPAAHVIGVGEVGRRVADALRRARIQTHPVTRIQGWDEALADRRGLYLVCVREEALAEVLDTLCDVPSERLVVIQNGWIRPLLRDHPQVTRGLIWFIAKGEFFQILRPNVFSGPMARDLALALAAGGLPSSAVERGQFDRLEADKMGFNCVVGLPLAVHRSSLGDYLVQHPDEAKAVFEEAVAVCSAAAGVDPESGGWPAFCETARHIDWVRISEPKALDFRNRAVVALAAEHALGAPVNSKLLRTYTERCATNRRREAEP